MTITECNDVIRLAFPHGQGLPPGVRATYVWTGGVNAWMAEHDGRAFRVVQALVNGCRFTRDNDPWGEHDLAVVEVARERLWLKIDDYGPGPHAGHERFVATLLFPREY